MIVRDKSNSFKLLFAWRGTVLPKVLPTILGIMVLSFIAGFVAQFQWYYVTTVPAVGFTMFGVVISIFLGFRNNACYDRWWEGRKLWGALVANTRHLSRDSHFLAPNERESLLYQMLLFVAILRDRLRGQNIQRSQFGYTKIDDHYLDWLDQQINAPQRVLEAMQQQLIKLVQQGQMSDVIYMTIQKHVIEMGGHPSGLRSYSQHAIAISLLSTTVSGGILFLLGSAVWFASRYGFLDTVIGWVYFLFIAWARRAGTATRRAFWL